MKKCERSWGEGFLNRGSGVRIFTPVDRTVGKLGTSQNNYGFA
jgi:hypothetical protein